MKPDIAERRERTFELLIVEGRPYSEVVTKISYEYDITESGVKTDISRMEDWLPKLVESSSARKDGLTRLLELRKNRQKLARLAKETDDPEVEMEVRDRINDSLDLDVALSQSLGHTDREPAQVEVEHEYNVNTDIVEVSEEDVKDPDG